MMGTKHVSLVCILSCLFSSSALGRSLATAAHSVIPKEVQQIICIDYRSLKASPTALALKDRVLPANMKAFLSGLRSVGIDPDSDMESFTFASFPIPNRDLQMVGIAQGSFPKARVVTRFKLRKVRPATYRNALIYPVGAMAMTFLDDFTVLFGDDAAVKFALDVRDGKVESLDSNTHLADLISAGDGVPVWSVLDTVGTPNMLKASLGDAAQLTEFDMIKNRVLSSHYIMDFNAGFRFDLDMVTSDALTATALSSLVKAGLMYRRLTANQNEAVALDAVTITSENNHLRVRLRVEDKHFESLLHSDVFAAMSR